MAFDWNDYARLAEELPTRKDDASLRTAISRFYHSVYHQARDYLLDKGVPLSTTNSSHKIVWKEYQRMGGSCRAVGINGDRMHKNRRVADYERSITDINHLVDATFDIGRNLLAYLEQCQKRERV